jgi:hypothetical protein
LAAPKGNKYGAKDRKFIDSLNSAIREDEGAKLLMAAKQLLLKASKGNLAAIEMLATRLDGRPLPMLSSEHDGELVISWLGAAITTRASQPLTIDHQVSEPSAAYATLGPERVPSANENQSHPSK